jgi:CHAT domain-containing protein
MNNRIRPFYELLSSQPESDVSASEVDAIDSVGIGIARLLFAEVADMIAGRTRIIIAPDGALNLLPLAALPLRDLLPNAGPEVTAEIEIVRVPSASILMLQRTAQGQADPSKGATILAVAGRTNDRGDPLLGAVREVQRLGESFEGVRVRILPDAGPMFGIDELAGYDILHLASHVRTDNQNPWQSAVQLSPGDETGNLRAADIAGLALTARLVVLSSCQSAGGRILWGEGILGLSSAFISADVPAVLGTLWPVDDEAAAGFMDRFYAEMAAGRTAAAAVREAQRRLRAAASTRHPFYWAGFTLIGDGQIHVPLRRRPKPIWIPLAAILAVGGAGAIVGRRWRREA